MATGIKKGVRQGCCLSPVSFQEKAIKEIKRERKIKSATNNS